MASFRVFCTVCEKELACAESRDLAEWEAENHIHDETGIKEAVSG